MSRPPARSASAPPSGAAAVTRRAALTAGAACGLTGLYAAYAAAVTPLLESDLGPTARAAGRGGRIVPPKANRELADRFLSHVPFARDAAYQVGSGESMMYWNTWEIVERGGKTALKVEPFAMLVTDSSGGLPEDGGKAPTTVTADVAYLRFESPISEQMVASPGRVVAATFGGAVRVDGEDGLRVSGSNFQFREGDAAGRVAALYSARPVTFRHGGRRTAAADGRLTEEIVGGHEGAGEGVEVKLFRTKSPGTYDNVAVDGLAEVAVRGPVAVTLRGGRLPGLDAAGGPLGDAPEETPEADENRQPVRITATDRLVFDPEANTALFTAARPGGVRAWRDQPPDARPKTPAEAGPDELIADDLLVTFTPSTEKAKAEAAAVRADRANRQWEDRGFYAADDDLEATAVIANGAPVRVNSPARRVTTTSARLEHDVRADVLTLLGRADAAAAEAASPADGVRQAAFRRAALGPAAPAAGDWVDVTLPDAVIRCPKLTVLPPSGADDPTPDPLLADAPRRVDAAGPGTLLRNDPKTGELAAKVTWPGHLVTMRDAATGRDVVTLTGPESPARNADGHTNLSDQVIVQTFAEGADLAADRVVLELEKNPDAEAEAATSLNAEQTDDGALSGADPLGGKLRPARAVATGSVRMKGPELLAGAKRVDVDFADPPPRPQPKPGDAVAGTGGPGTGPAAAPAAEDPAAEDEDEPGRVSKFYADDIVATMVRPRRENGVEVEEGYVSRGVATGQVGLFQDAPPPETPSGEPGDARYARAAKAVLTGTGPGEQLLTLLGKPATGDAPAIPAELNGSGSDLTGPEIRFDPKRNTAVVVGSGTLDLPVRGGGMPGFAADSDPEPAQSALAAGGGDAPPDPPSRKSVQVVWGESMTFDGSVATFYGGARTLFHGVEGTTGGADFTEDNVRLFCNLMTVSLTKRVVFGGSLSGVEKPEGDDEPEIDVIVCHGQVNIRGRQDAPDPRQANPGDRLIPREAQRLEASFGQLEVTWKTGDFTAQGAGEMKVWRRDDQTAPPPAAAAAVRPNAPRQRLVALPCELIHVTFKNEVRGNLNGPDAIFHPDGGGRVTVDHGPVRNFGVPLTNGPTESMPAGASRMISDRLELRHVADPAAPRPAAGADPPKTRELFASGDVEIDGHGEPSGSNPGAWYSANAPRATYNEAKGRLELSGTADGMVQLYRAETETGPRTLATGRTVIYYPDTNQVDFKGIQGVDGLP